MNMFFRLSDAFIASKRFAFIIRNIDIAKTFVKDGFDQTMCETKLDQIKILED